MGVVQRAFHLGTFSFLAGCASTPDVTIDYYLPKATLQTTVVRTVGCDDKDNVFIVNTVISKVVYSRDETRFHSFRIKDADGWATNTELTVNFYEDGRLSGLNATQTGQGAEILKSALTLAGTLLAAQPVPLKTVKDECLYVKSVGKDKGLTLTFSDIDELASAPIKRDTISPIPESRPHYAKVSNIVGEVCLEGTARAMRKTRASYQSNGKEAFTVKLVEPALVDIEVFEGPQGNCTSKFWTGTVAAPQLGTPFELPVSKASAFGKQSFALTLAESGAITMIKYGKDSGAASALGAANEMAGALTTTDAEKLAALTTEAGIIAQQQRLIRCKTNPSACE